MGQALDSYDMPEYQYQLEREKEFAIQESIERAEARVEELADAMEDF